MLDPWRNVLEATLLLALQAAVGGVLTAVHGYVGVGRSSRMRRAARRRAACRATWTMLPAALGVGAASFAIGSLSGHPLRVEDPGRWVVALAAAPLVGASLQLIRAGRLERRGSWRAARALARQAVGPAALGSVAVVGATVAAAVIRSQGNVFALPATAWLVSASLLALGGLAGKPRPWGWLALGMQLGAAALTVG